MTTRDDLYRLIDELPEGDLEVAKRLLEDLTSGDPVLRALATASVDDEPETEEERLAVEEGKADLAAGRVVSLEDVKRELGL
ncbi:MAG: hypothetical protein HY331_15655 [Chloroflexi bacterium]|nr:hypothetical protein [Chloroflexota bacterium]